MDLLSIVSIPNAHFKQPSMRDWLIVKDGYIVYENEPSTKVLLTVKQLTADNWETDTSEAEFAITKADMALTRAMKEGAPGWLVDSLSDNLANLKRLAKKA